MKMVSAEELQKDIGGYLRLIVGGETIVITQADEPVAEIKPLTPDRTSLRPYAQAKGAFVVPPTFDAPLPEEILRSFEA